MRKLTKVALSALLACSSAPSLAGVYVVTYTGYTSFVDSGGMFGTAGTSYTDIPFLSSMTFSTDIPNTNYSVPGTTDYHNTNGQPSSTPVVTLARLTMNSVTRLFQGTFYSQALTSPIDLNQLSFTASSGSTGANTLQYMLDPASGGGNIAPVDFSAPYSAFDNAVTNYGGSFALLNPAGTITTSGNLRGTSISIGAVVTPMPEPSTWMTLIVGFGLVGWSLRTARRRENLAPESRAV